MSDVVRGGRRGGKPSGRPGGRGPAKPSAGQPRRPADPPRRAAYDVLRAVAADDAYANLVLPRMLRERGIVGRDAAFATELTYGTLRASGTLDAIVDSVLDRAPEDDVRDVLRLGAYQLLRMRVPPHAAVSSTVDLAPLRAAGFVNAILRRIGERDWDGWIAAIAPDREADPIGHLAIRYAHPPWVVSAFADAVGLAEVEAALAADDSPPSVHLVTSDAPALAAEVGGSVGAWASTAVYLPSGDPADLAAVREGRARVQDEGSQLVASAFAAAPVEGADARWLDLAAGPGGKTATAAAVARVRGARLLAAELHQHRAALVARACRGLPVDVVQADATVPAWAEGAFDRVLVDAPCSGLGALRRRPEARWRRQPSDIPELTRLQRALLASALTAVRPGGIVAYATCSPHLAETRAVVADAVRRSGAEMIDARPLLPGVPDLGPGPTVQLWPHRHGTDAMYLALLRRR